MYARRSVPAAGAGLHPQGLIHPGASNWGDWDPGAAAGQTECLSQAAGGIHVIYIYISSLLTDPHPEQPERGTA